MRNEMKLKEWNEKVKTAPVAQQLCRGRVQLHASLKYIGVDGLNDLFWCAKLWQIELIR